MVKVGDVVLVTVNVALPYFANPAADQVNALTSRLRTSGFEVVSASDPFGDAIFAGHGWKQLVVSVRPVTSDYGAASDVGSIVAGAAQYAGLTVDFNSISARVVQTAQQPGRGPLPPVPNYTDIQNLPGASGTQRGFFDDLSASLGISKGTLQIAGLALVAIVAVSFARK